LEGLFLEGLFLGLQATSGDENPDPFLPRALERELSRSPAHQEFF